MSDDLESENVLYGFSKELIVKKLGQYKGNRANLLTYSTSGGGRKERQIEKSSNRSQ